jgi:hypothetical protein
VVGFRDGQACRAVLVAALVVSRRRIADAGIQLWQQQALLESVSPVERLEKILSYLQAGN